jgi:hypothetical protein
MFLAGFLYCGSVLFGRCGGLLLPTFLPRRHIEA